MFRRPRPRRSPRRPPPARRRLTAAVTLLAMVVCQLPAPVPVAAGVAAEKDRSEAYPCRDRPCGCGSAAACWTGCCCFTNAQKVAWARANGVTIPAFVHAAARTEAAAPSETREPPRSSCCGGSAGSEKPAAKSSCCGTAESAACCETTAAETTGDDAPPTPLGWMAQKCRGEIAACGALPWALEPALFEVPPAPRAGRDRPRSTAGESHGQDPPTPPPRLRAAALLF